MAEIKKGKVSIKHDDYGIRVQPYGSKNTVTPFIPLEKDMQVKIGDIVAFVVFDDGTGIIIKKFEE